MKLYYKFIFGRVIFTILTFMLFIFYFTFFIMESFEKLEDSSAQEKVAEINSVLMEKAKDLHFANTDWSIWSDTYDFINDSNNEYIESNIEDGGYLTTGADMILYLNEKNEVHYEAYYDVERETELEIPGLLIPRLKNIEIPEAELGVKGILVFNADGLIVSKHKIVDSRNEEASNGTLVLARFIDSDLINELSDILGLKLESYVIMNTEEIPESAVKNKHDISLTLKFDSLVDDKSFVITTKLRRQIYELGKDTVKHIMEGLMLMMLTSILLSSYLLRESVLKSINNLLNEIRGIALKLEKNEQLKVEVNDEFGELKNGINMMLSSLEDARVEISRREEKYKTLYEESAAIHLVLDDKNEFIDVNNAMTKFLNMKKQDIVGTNIYDYVSESDTEWLKEYIENVFLGMDNENIDLTFKNSEGEEKTMHLYPNCLFLSEENDKFSILITGSDITDRIEMTRKLEELATFDPMTQSYNRRVGLQMLAKRMRHAKRYENDLTICFIDVNGLKKVNDTFGHNAGDQLIKDSAEVLMAITRDSDILVRLGGDEFLIILPNCDSEQAEEVWDRVLEVLGEINEYKDDYKISMSHGVVQYEVAKDWTMDEFVEIADQKMYEEKLRLKQARTD